MLFIRRRLLFGTLTTHIWKFMPQRFTSLELTIVRRVKNFDSGRFYVNQARWNEPAYEIGDGYHMGLFFGHEELCLLIFSVDTPTGCAYIAKQHCVPTTTFFICHTYVVGKWRRHTYLNLQWPTIESEQTSMQVSDASGIAGIMPMLSLWKTEPSHLWTNASCPFILYCQSAMTKQADRYCLY